jgi:hypothetical protein
MTTRQALLLATLCLAAAPAGSQPPRPTAFFGFTLNDTSLQGETQGPRPDEASRLARLDQTLEQTLLQTGCCTQATLAPAAVHAQQSCTACDIDLARDAGAEIAITGWVQKVSNLILNMNVIVRDVPTGRVLNQASVDIRGNTDESWSRALAYLIRNQLHPATWRPTGTK